MCCMSPLDLQQALQATWIFFSLDQPFIKCHNKYTYIYILFQPTPHYVPANSTSGVTFYFLILLPGD